MNAGVTIRPEDLPAPVMETILILEDKINSYKKKQQEKIKNKMRSQNRGI